MKKIFLSVFLSLMVTFGNAQPKIGDMAPEIVLKTIADKEVSLSGLKGKYVLVDFWASWCMPCRKENPNVVAAYNKFKDKNFTILGVSLDQDKNGWSVFKIDDIDGDGVDDLIPENFHNGKYNGLKKINGVWKQHIFSFQKCKK